ncbi:unnamed protein product [Haemonchus placei]|uniref:Reverse transcriptase domain-containing protein n=1 Tax=Haemonchus placei TaxID=6290 RepID=A0A0N4VSM3_HAEPC|nr:unnamed protein product [Haemonchus placei]
MVKVITDSLTAYCSEARDLWNDLLQPVVFAYNTSANVTTGYSPYFIVYGRCPITWSDILHELPSSTSFTSDDFADQFTIGLKNIIINVGKEIASKTAQYKMGYDLHNKVCQKDLFTGDLVLLHDDTVRPKLTNQWKGPFVIEDINRPNITITNLVGRPMRQAVHINRLKLYSPRSMPLDASNTNTTPSFEQNIETPSSIEQPIIRRSHRHQEKQQRQSSADYYD